MVNWRAPLGRPVTGVESRGTCKRGGSIPPLSVGKGSDGSRNAVANGLGLNSLAGSNPAPSVSRWERFWQDNFEPWCATYIRHMRLARFKHFHHTTSEPDWYWPMRITQLVYDHEKDGI